VDVRTTVKETTNRLGAVDVTLIDLCPRIVLGAPQCRGRPPGGVPNYITAHSNHENSKGGSKTFHEVGFGKAARAPTKLLYSQNRISNALHDRARGRTHQWVQKVQGALRVKGGKTKSRQKQRRRKSCLLFHTQGTEEHCQQPRKPGQSVFRHA